MTGTREYERSLYHEDPTVMASLPNHGGALLRALVTVLRQQGHEVRMGW